MLKTSLTCDAQGHALGAVDVEVEPGRVGPRAVEQALQPGGLVAAGDDLVADALQLGQAEVAAVLDDQLEAAGRAQAVDRAAPPKADTMAPRTSSLAAFAQLRGDGVGGQVRRRAARRTASSMTYIEPRLGALAFRISDWPEMPTVCATPGVSRASLLDVGHDAFACAPPRRSRAAAR